MLSSPLGARGFIWLGVMTIIYSQSNSPTFNLATEEYLFSQSQDDMLFLYVNNPSVIIGSNQAIQNEVDLEFCTKNNIQVVRRMSGGGAVYHDTGNLNYCFISNKQDNKSSLSSDFLEPIVSVLNELDIPVSIGKRKDLWLQNEFKISGTASHVGKMRELHHGTLLYDTKLDVLENALSPKSVDSTIKATSSVRSSVKNLRAYFENEGEIRLNSVGFFDLLIQKLGQYFQVEQHFTLTDVVISEISLLEEKYRSNDWTFKK